MSSVNKNNYNLIGKSNLTQEEVVNIVVLLFKVLYFGM